jgi:hypothetical protein
VDAGLGLKIAIILAVSNNLQGIFKLKFADSRPYWVSAQIKVYIGLIGTLFLMVWAWSNLSAR